MIWTAEPTASGWLKIHQYAEVPGTGWTPPTPLHIWLLSGEWLIGVVNGGGVSSWSSLGGFRGWGLGLEVWTPLEVVILIWLTGRWGMIAAWILRGATQTPEGMSRR